jgi:gliding motility-associated-like protein
VPYDGSSEYNWCQGEAAQFIYADEPGDYCFQFIDELGCLQEGNIHLVHIDHDADLYIPNAFTPNNDGRNDVFQPKGTEVRDYEFSVWNRWGDQVFSSVDQSAVWDGSYQGGTHYVQDGIYTYRVTYNGTCSAEKILKTGYITVLR